MHRINKIIEINKNVMENLKRTQDVLIEEMEKVDFNIEKLNAINDILSTFPEDAHENTKCNKKDSCVKRNHKNNRRNHNIYVNNENVKNSEEKKENNRKYEIEFSIPMIEIDDIYDLDENEDLLENLFDYLNI